MNKITNHQLYRLIAAHLKEIVREPEVLFWGIVFPILMAWGLGIAFSNKQDMTREIALVRHTQTSETAKSKLLDILEHHPAGKKGEYTMPLKNEKLGNVTLTFRECTNEDARVMLKKGTVTLIIDETNGATQYNFDPANAEAQLLYQLVKGVVYNGAGYYSSHQQEIKPLTVAGTRYIDFLVPGLLAMGIMFSCSWGISYVLIERRSKKLLRRMVATPMYKSNMLIALTSARFTMNIAESLLLFAFGWWYFDIQIQGSLLAFALLFVSGNIAFAGIAILISSRTGSSEVGNGLINAVTTPMMVLSGVFFSYHHFPEWAMPVIQNLPLTMLADGVRAVFNEGAGLMEVSKAIIVLSATGVITFIAGLKLFKWY